MNRIFAILILILSILYAEGQNPQPLEIAYWNVIAMGKDRTSIPENDINVGANLVCYNNSLILSIIAADYNELLLPDIIINKFSFDQSAAYNNKHIGYSGIGYFRDNPTQKFKVTISISKQDYGRDAIILHFNDGNYYMACNLISEKMIDAIYYAGLFGYIFYSGDRKIVKESLQQFIIENLRH